MPRVIATVVASVTLSIIATVIMAFVAPMVAGHIVASSGSFTTVFYTAAAALIAGVLSYVFLLGRIEPIAE